MARLFITPREMNFINDISKEIIKDVVGQRIFYFPISEAKSKVHDVYEEAAEKIFDNPIEIDCLVKYNPQEISTGRFGSEENYTIEAYIQSRDLIDKQIEILEGDFFSYGTKFFEVVTAPTSQTLFGQIEFDSFITVTGKQARKGTFLSKIFGPTAERYSDADAVQDNFVQQRGFASNKQGETNDFRELRKRGIIDDPVTGPKEVTSKSSNNGSSFYGDE